MLGLELSRKLWKEESVGRGSEEFKGERFLANGKGEAARSQAATTRRIADHYLMRQILSHCPLIKYGPMANATNTPVRSFARSQREREAGILVTKDGCLLLGSHDWIGLRICVG